MTLIERKTMEIKIEGNPGTGNTFQEINIQHVDNFNPNATTVINNYGACEETEDGKKSRNKKSLNDVREIPPIREQILAYVSCLTSIVNDDKKSGYLKMWNDILDIQVVSDKIYDPGRQQGTAFNRNLVANIIHYLNGQKLFSEYVPSHIAELLEGSSDHSVRGELGKDPSDESIVSRLNRYFE